MQAEFEGIVLFSRPHRDNDGLVKIFTREYGPKMFFVRSFKKPNHPHNNQLLTLTCNNYIGQINEEGLSFINDASTISMFHKLQLDPYKQAHGSYIAQLSDAAVEDGQPDELVYATFKRALYSIEEGKPPQIITIYMELFFLKYFGVGLDFTHCSVCGKTKQAFDFSVKRNGLLCPGHYYLDPFRLHANPQAIYVLGLLSQVRVDQINQIDLSDELYQDMRKIIDEIYQEYVGLRLKSKTFLDSYYQADIPDKYRIKRRPRTDFN